MSELEIRILKMIRHILKSGIASDYSYELKEKVEYSLDFLSLLIGEDEEEQKGEENNG